MSYQDRYGTELQEGDPVLCDGSQAGVITEFGGIGVYVCMDPDGEVMDWNLDQVEFNG